MSLLLDENLLVIKPEDLSDSALQLDSAFLADNIELLCDNDAWITLRSALSSSICKICDSSAIQTDNVRCDKCKTRYHKACVKIDRRRKVWTCAYCA